MLKVAWAAFPVACFSGLSDIHECLGHLQMAAYPLGKWTAGCNSPHDWLMSLAMHLAGGENDTNGCHLADFSEDVAFAHHFVATPLFHPTRVLLVLAMPVKSLSKKAGNSATDVAISPIVGGLINYK